MTVVPAQYQWIWVSISSPWITNRWWIFCERISTTNVALLVKRDLKAGVMETGCRRKQRKAFRREDGLRSLCWFALRLPRTLSTATLQFPLCCLQRRASVFFQIREQLILKMGVNKLHKLSAAGAIWFPAFAPPLIKERIYLGSYATFTRKCPKVSDQDVETAFRIWYTIHEDVKASIYNDWR